MQDNYDKCSVLDYLFGLKSSSAQLDYRKLQVEVKGHLHFSSQ